MVTVVFGCISMLQGVKCVLDGVTKYSDSSGLAYFYGISQGSHSYSVTPPSGFQFVSGHDNFNRPLDESGTTVIEWAPVPGVDWPEDQLWNLNFTFEAVDLGEFRFDSWNPPGDTREVFIVGSAWPALVRLVDFGESVYAHYVVKNVGSSSGKATITVKDLDTGETVTTWSSPELAPNERFKTSGSGAYIGKMPARDWRLEFKVEP